MIHMRESAAHLTTFTDSTRTYCIDTGTWKVIEKKWALNSVFEDQCAWLHNMLQPSFFYLEH